ncbi:hypothetical protein KUCAC02_037950, partial [Chaenocephalus aceratus]
MMEEEGEELQEEAELQVLVLSPRCWAVSSLCFLNHPDQHLPEHLSTYLSSFTHFYSHSQSLSSLPHSRPRRLQWTWLGHAELTFSGCTLHVSTLQMFLLLQLNQHQ